MHININIIYAHMHVFHKTNFHYFALVMPFKKWEINICMCTTCIILKKCANNFMLHNILNIRDTC